MMTLENAQEHRQIAQSKVDNLKPILERALTWTSYKENIQDIENTVNIIIKLISQGWWAPGKLERSPKKYLIANTIMVARRIINDNEVKVSELDLTIERLTPKVNPIGEIEKAITSGKTETIGVGEVIKDSWYEVHMYEGKYYAAIFYDSMSSWILDGMTKEIKENEIKKYI